MRRTTSRGARVVRSVTTLATAALIVTTAATLPARADEDYPTGGDVRRAREHSAAAARDVTAMQAQLQRTSARVRAADVEVSQAAEEYDQARVELQDSRRQVQQATAAAAAAAGRVSAARRAVGRLAAAAYRGGGGSVASLDVVLSPSGPDQVLERAAMLQTLGSQRQRTVRQMDDARVVATSLQRTAAQAVLRQQVAARRADAARAAAQRQADAAHALLTEENRTRERLVTELARARRTTVGVERARQAGLERAAERRRVAEQEARARRAAARAEQRRAREAREAAADRAAEERRTPDRSTPDRSTPDRSSPDRSSPDRVTEDRGDTGSDAGSDAGSSGRDEADGGSSSGSASGGGSAVSFAAGKIGLPYLWGGDGPGSYDCSGLTMRAWAHAGVSLPHSSRLQYRQTGHVSLGSIRPGDLLFYATDPSNPATIHHVTIYAGGGMMIEAPYTGARVRRVPVRYSDRMPYAGRP
jgi:cell wall-associated NlpC family hydrolase